MKIKLATQKEIKVSFADGEDEANIIFSTPKVTDLINYELLSEKDGGGAMLNILKSNFLRFEGNFSFEDEKGKEIKVKNFDDLVELGGINVGQVVMKCLMAVNSYIKEVQTVGKKSK
jgi:hypothetical protein